MTGLLLATTGLKLVLAAHWGWTNDIPQTLVEAESFLAGEGWRPAGPAIFPLGYYVLASLPLLAAQWTGWPYAFWLKVPAILADLGIAWLLLRQPGGGDRAAFCYLLNPVSFLLSVYHGQLHTAATAAAVLSLWAMDRGRQGLCGVALGLAASVRQHFGILLLPLALRQRAGRLALLLGCALTVFLTNVTLWEAYREGRLVAPVWAYGAWGYGMVLLQGPRVLALAGWTGLQRLTEGLNQALVTIGPSLCWGWAAAYGLWAGWRWRRRRLPDAWRSALLFLVGLYVISPGFGVQWFIWALPFWLVVDRRGAILYSALAGAFLAGSYWQWTLNARYGLASITANLDRLAPWDLAGVCGVGVAGLLTWVWCMRTAWRLAWR